MLEMVIGPVLAASGVDYKPSRLSRPTKQARTQEQKETDLLRKLARAPVGVKVVKTSQGKPEQA